jgi:hypothetical protein
MNRQQPVPRTDAATIDLMRGDYFETGSKVQNFESQVGSAVGVYSWEISCFRALHFMALS